MATVFEGLIQNIPAVFYRCACDKSWTTHFMNNAIEEVTGYPASDFITNKVRTFTSVIHPDDREYVSTSINNAIGNGSCWEIEYRLMTKSGCVKWVAETGIAVLSSSDALKYLDGFIQEITLRKEMELALKVSEQQIRDMAFTDSVTGLANRNLFSDRLEQMVLQAKRYQTEFALLFIDLDHFKPVNDNYGHLAGDKLLNMTAERISSTFRDSDVVARFGGDEFLVIVKNTSDIAEIETIAGKLLSRLASPYYLDDLELQVTASIGITISPKDGLSGHTLIRNADKAMYSAKLAGKNCYRVYTPELPEKTAGIHYHADNKIEHVDS